MVLHEWDPRRGRQGRAWRRLVRTLCPPGSLCEMPVCLYPELDRVIVFGLRRNHPHGPSLDHIVNLEHGGHPTALWNLRPAHFGCNAGNAGKARRGQPPTVVRPRSRVVPPPDLS